VGRVQYTELATRYCADVLQGKIPACEFVKQACQRQVDDLARKSFEFHYDEAAANRVCSFIEKLPHVKGSTWAGQSLRLEPWQVFILTTAFGWLDAQGRRRFRVVYIEVPRKNGKSCLTSGVGLYCLTADNELGAEVVTAATKADQARIVLDMARMMVKQTPSLAAHFGIEVREHVILKQKDASTFRALSKDNQGSQDGQNIHCAIIDELHAHKTRDMVAALDTATGARTQPIIWQITTAGNNRAGICYETRDYIKKILNGSQSDDRTFGIIYTVDEGDFWDSEESWRKANPNYGVSVNPEDLKRKAAKALKVASAQNEFLTKHLNVWVNASTAWMNMAAWDACGDPSLDIEDFEGRPCYIGLDLATREDIAAKAYIFPEDDGYVLFGKFYLPEETVEQSENSQYAGWVKDGWITATDGPVIDFDAIEQDLIEDSRRFQVTNIAYDPWQATELAQRLLKEGCPMIEYRNTVQNFSEPMKTLASWVAEKKLKHDANPALAWMFSNVVAKVDAKDNIYPRKEFPQNKIDGAVASIMPVGLIVQREQTGPSWLENNGVLYAG